MGIRGGSVLVPWRPFSNAAGVVLLHYYYTSIGLPVTSDRRERCFWWLRKLSAFAQAAGETRCIRALAPLEWVSLTLPEQACVVGDDEVGFAASANSGDKRRRGVTADSRQGRRWHRSRVVRSRLNTEIFVCLGAFQIKNFFRALELC